MAALGVLAENEQLPSVRSVAQELGVNVNTVQKAYQMLERDGVIVSYAGKGSFLASGEQGAAPAAGHRKDLPAEAARQASECGVPEEEILDCARKGQDWAGEARRKVAGAYDRSTTACQTVWGESRPGRHQPAGGDRFGVRPGGLQRGGEIPPCCGPWPGSTGPTAGRFGWTGSPPMKTAR